MRQLFMEINSMKNMQERQRWSQTLQGRYFNVLGHFFSIYCLYKIFIVSKAVNTFNILILIITITYLPSARLILYLTVWVVKILLHAA